MVHPSPTGQDLAVTFSEVVAKTREFLFQRQTAYRLVFAGPSGDIVLKDLAKFCRAGRSTFHADPYAAARLDGRRECWLRIQNHLHLSQEQLWHLQSGLE